MRRLIVLVAVLTGSLAAVSTQSITLPVGADVVKFAVIGDNGNGQPAQYDVGRQMLIAHGSFPFDFVVMMGDNLYGSQEPRDFFTKFESPYGPLLRMGIPFYAALGNHDQPTNRNYPGFNMGGERYYSFARGGVRFFIFDSNLMDPKQLQWGERALSDAIEDWKIVIFHHPIYSDGDRHGSDVSLRVVLEPLLLRHGVDVVLSGHEHIYERIRPQHGISYFIVGSSGQLRKGGLTASSMTAAGFDQDCAFMVVAIAGEQLFFQTISRTGTTVDSGAITRRVDP